SLRADAMKRRSRAGGKPVKARPRKALEPRGRSAPKALSHRGAAPARETEVARLTRELNDSLKRETATADVLKVISRSTFDLQPVLETLVESATRLCGAMRGHIFQFDGEYLRFAAAYGAFPGFA